MSLPMSEVEEWLGKICRLKVDRARPEPAPHKPLLLLVIFDILEAGELSDGMLELTPSLAFRFSVYGSVVAHRRTQQLRVLFPFFHLRSDGFWQVLDENRQPTSERSRARFAVIDPGFLAAASDPEFRLHQIAADCEILPCRGPGRTLRALRHGVPADDEIAEQVRYEPIAEATRIGRDARFRIVVLSNYTFSVPLTGYRLTTISSGAIVDAAHIYDYSKSRNNDPRNGMALCRNAHWMFDARIMDAHRPLHSSGRNETL